MTFWLLSILFYPYVINAVLCCEMLHLTMLSDEVKVLKVQTAATMALLASWHSLRHSYCVNVDEKLMKVEQLWLDHNVASMLLQVQGYTGTNIDRSVWLNSSGSLLFCSRNCITNNIPCICRSSHSCFMQSICESKLGIRKYSVICKGSKLLESTLKIGKGIIATHVDVIFTCVSRFVYVRGDI